MTVACNRKLTNTVLSNEIEQLQTILATQQDAALDLKSAHKLIDQSRVYNHAFPQDSLASVYLFRAADVARGIGQYDLAIQLWGEVQEQHPAFQKVPDALFLQGFTYENDLKNIRKAEEYYLLFVQRFSQHHLISAVQSSLQNLSKSPEELIEEFKKNQ